MWQSVVERSSVGLQSILPGQRARCGAGDCKRQLGAVLPLLPAAALCEKMTDSSVRLSSLHVSSFSQHARGFLSPQSAGITA